MYWERNDNAMVEPVQQGKEIVLEVEALSKEFNAGTPFLKDVTFSVAASEVYGLLGRPGAGKSTVLKILAGFDVPTSGRLKMLGADVSPRNVERRRRLAFID